MLGQPHIRPTKCVDNINYLGQSPSWKNQLQLTKKELNWAEKNLYHSRRVLGRQVTDCSLIPIPWNQSWEVILTGVIKNGQNSKHSGSTVLKEKYMYFSNKSSAYLWAVRNMPSCVHHFLVTLIICLSHGHSLNNYELIGDFAQSEPLTYFAAQSVRPWTPPLCFDPMADPVNSLFEWRAIDTCGLFTAEPEMPSSVNINRI